jgi:hypothetical protein
MAGMLLAAGCGGNAVSRAAPSAPPPAPAVDPAEEMSRVGGTGTDFIANRIRELHRVGGEGRPPVTGVVRGSLETAGTRHIEVPVRGQHCYVAVAAGVPSVRILDLRVLDPYGNERDTDETEDALPTVRFCPSVGGASWKIEVRMYEGYGNYGVQVFGSEQTAAH